MGQLNVCLELDSWEVGEILRTSLGGIRCTAI
jgi:hypothetical protein